MTRTPFVVRPSISPFSCHLAAFSCNEHLRLRRCTLHSSSVSSVAAVHAVFRVNCSKISTRRQPKCSLCSWLRNHPITTKTPILLTSNYNPVQILTKNFPLWTLIPLPGDYKIDIFSSQSRNRNFNGYHVQTGADLP